MELDELKNIWKSNEPGYTLKGEEELAIMLKGNSRSIISKLKRSVWFELTLTVGVGIALLVYSLTLPSGAMKWTSIFLLMLVAYSFYYVKKLTLLNQFESTHENIRANLEKLIDNLTSYLKFYKRSYAILYPIYFFLGLFFIALERGTSEFIILLKQPRTIITLIGLAVFFFICSTWLTSWYLKKLYGNHLDKLNALLKDLKSDQSVVS